jgi:hypothetical protein
MSKHTLQNPLLESWSFGLSPDTSQPSPLSAGYRPLGLLAGPCTESHNRGTEEIARLPQLLRAVDTPPALDCGTFVSDGTGQLANHFSF